MKKISTTTLLLLSGMVFLAGFALAADAAEDQGHTASVKGALFSDSNGDGVRGPGETPARGVTVKLLGKNGEVVARTTTNDKGVYVFSGLPDGKYELVFEFSDSSVVRSRRFKVDAKNQNIAFLAVPSSASGEKKYALRRAQDGVNVAGPAPSGLGDGLSRLLLTPNPANVTGGEVSQFQP